MTPNKIYTRPIWLDSDQQTLKVIDQRFLPHSVSVLNLKTADDVIMAIGDMVVRGAPLIGVTAAYGVYLSVVNSKTQDDPEFLSDAGMHPYQVQPSDSRKSVLGCGSDAGKAFRNKNTFR